MTKLWSRGQLSTSQLLKLPLLVAIAKASVKRVVIFSMKIHSIHTPQSFRANWELNSPFGEQDPSVAALSSIGELRKGWSGRQGRPSQVALPSPHLLLETAFSSKAAPSLPNVDLFPWPIC